MVCASSISVHFPAANSYRLKKELPHPSLSEEMTFKNEFECQHPQEIPLNVQKWKYSLLCVNRLSFLILSFLPFAPHGGGWEREGFAKDIFKDFSNDQLDPLILVFRYLCPEFENRLDV